MKRIIKSLVLGMLILGSIYQVITLWFDNVSDRNFFYTFIESATDIIKEPKSGQKNEYAIRPRQLGVYLGASDKDFTIVGKSNPNYEDLYNTTVDAITEILKKGKLVDIYKEDDVLWKDRGIIFTLAFPLTRSDLANDLSVSQNLFGSLSTVRSLGVIPANDQNNLIKAYFIDEASKEVFLYALSPKELQANNDQLNVYISQMEAAGVPAYISTLKNDIDFFKSNILLPLTTEGVFYSSEISPVTPYVIDGVIDKKTLEPYVNNFFTNPDVVWIIDTKEGIIYGDDSAIVNFNKESVLEYSSTNMNRDVKLTLSQAINVACEFMAQDAQMTNESYYLESYDKEGDAFTFYYNFAYNDLPIQLKGYWSEEDTDQYPIEITVKNGIVNHYKSSLKSWQNSTAAKEVYELRLQVALDDKFLVTHKVLSNEIEDMYLSYVQSGEIVKLMWIIKYHGDYFSFDL